MLDIANEFQRITREKKTAFSTKHVHDANETCDEFNDDGYRGQYLAIYKKAAKAFIDLREIKEKARGAREPGKYFLQVAGELVGTRKKKVRTFTKTPKK